jgi:endonuclease/exonuclease/phosphatase family metal-dependent hydrolase
MKKRSFSTRASKTLVRLIWQILTLIAAVGWALLLISSFSNRLSPLSYPFMPFAGLFFPVILSFNLLFLPVWLLFRKWRQAVVAFAALLICGGAIHTYFPLHGKTKLPENSIKVMTYNVMKFGYLATHSASKPHPILEEIIEQDPDVICFQEYQPLGRLTNEVIRNALHALPHYSISTKHLVVFSKHPILSAQRLPIESEYNGATVLELDVAGRKLTLINVHLETNRISLDERTVYLDLTQDPNTQKLENFTHMMFQRLTPAFRKRAKQAQTIAQAIRNNKNPYLIVCGDFNDTPLSYAYRTIRGELKDAFVESGSGMGISFNRYRFLFRIDYILHSKNIKSYNCTVGQLKTSDHYPVYTCLQFLD